MKLRITPLFPVKRFAAMAAACVMLVSVAACGSKSDSGATVNPGEAIISVNNTEPQSPLVPADTNEMGGGKVIRYLFEGLVSYDVNGKQHLEVAKSITPNDDASQFTIVINDGWKFTNGRQFLRRCLELCGERQARHEAGEPHVHHQGLRRTAGPECQR